MEQGKVKWFDTAKGYGFIQYDDNSQGVFVHHSKISECWIKNLTVDQIIHYGIQTRNGKPNAVNLKLI
jgi:cold shock protein